MNSSSDTAMTKEEYLEGLGMPAPPFTHQLIINRLVYNFVRRFPNLSPNFCPGIAIHDNPKIIPDVCLSLSVGKYDFNVLL